MCGTGNSVPDPGQDPDLSGQWIRIRIQEGKYDQQKWKKNLKILCFEVLDVLFWGL